jgi:hypothetical protein
LLRRFAPRNDPGPNLVSGRRIKLNKSYQYCHCESDEGGRSNPVLNPETLIFSSPLLCLSRKTPAPPYNLNTLLALTDPRTGRICNHRANEHTSLLPVCHRAFRESVMILKLQCSRLRNPGDIPWSKIKDKSKKIKLKGKRYKPLRLSSSEALAKKDCAVTPSLKLRCTMCAIAPFYYFCIN